MVISRELFGTCLSCTIDAVAESAARNERMTLNARERMRTFPLESPKKRVSAPVAMEIRSLCSEVELVKYQKTVGWHSHIERIAAIFVCRHRQFSFGKELKGFP